MLEQIADLRLCDPYVPAHLCRRSALDSCYGQLSMVCIYVFFSYDSSALKPYIDSTHFLCKNFPTLRLTFCVKFSQRNPNSTLNFWLKGLSN